MARNTISARWLLGLASPGAWLLLGAWGLQEVEGARALTAPYATFFSFGALGAAALLSWYSDRGRVFFVAVAAILAVWGAGELATAGDLPALGAAFLLPLNFAFFAWVGERGIVSPRGLLKAGLIAAQALAVVVVGAMQGGALERFLRGGEASAGAGFPLTQQLAFAAAGLVLVAGLLRRRTKLEAGFLWALAAMFLGLRPGADAAALHIYSGAAGLVLLFAVVEHGYELAYRDELTGLPGRRQLEESLQELGGNYAIAMCDVDHFKKFNDTYGHDAGDQVLRMVAAKLSRVPGGGRAFRYGGEEFALVFTDRTAKEALPLAEAVRAAVAGTEFGLRGPDRPQEKPVKKPEGKASDAVRLTISIGLAASDGRRATPKEVLGAADAALYRAKESGRNCVIVA